MQRLAGGGHLVLGGQVDMIKKVASEQRHEKDEGQSRLGEEHSRWREHPAGDLMAVAAWLVSSRRRGTAGRLLWLEPSDDGDMEGGEAGGEGVRSRRACEAGEKT